ncbi:RusA family crossover junction endodeoxyribonuclease [Neobacillus vireti]|uniref:RusA family crossover junction endodeoxyribonuclease n=1 Tax=Neobacillus vireti TaxID=220686 RepID=UPI002FFDC8C6
MIHKVTLHNGAEISASLHNDLIVLKIQDDPKSWERPDFQNTNVMQDEKMMFFQHKLQYAFLSQMRNQGLQVFQTEVDIIINLCSKQSLLNIRLEYVLKAIMDACNKHVIADDRQVRNIIVQASTTKNQRIVADHIEIIIKDTLESQILTWSGDVFLTEKRIPISYDIGAKAHIIRNS